MLCDVQFVKINVVSCTQNKAYANKKTMSNLKVKPFICKEEEERIMGKEGVGIIKENKIYNMEQTFLAIKACS